MLFPEVIKRLQEEYEKRNTIEELNTLQPDPLMVAKRYKEEYSALVCALFAYGNAKNIVSFLNTLDMNLLDEKEAHIKKALQATYYRFQTPLDVQAFFITLSRLKREHISLESLFLEGYQKQANVLDGLASLLQALYDINPYRSQGYQFLLGTIPTLCPKSPYKRWNMYFRWMVRCDALDFGLWKGVHPKDLLVPLDTHTFHVGKQLGFIKRKSYDFKAVLELTHALARIEPLDPVKYDFALYRLGQENIIV